jgi:Acetyl xylan esterase (AXE1)
MRLHSSWLLCGLLLVAWLPVAKAEVPQVFTAGQTSSDVRHQDLQNLNGYFPFQPVQDAAHWPQRQQEIRHRILVSQGLWPLPAKSELNAVIHGRVERDGYVVDRVFFESAPGHFVTGSLYRPAGQAKAKSLPAILSPHGHWKDGRFHDAGDAAAKGEVESGAEKSLLTAHHPIQARAVQLARMGCLVLVYDMTGEADSIQIGHRPAKWSHLDTKQDWGFMSVQADLRLQNMMGLQTWNSIRALDFLLGLEETDPNRIGVTGASGGGTQSMIIAAIDERIAAAMPCVMVSTAMQGGCTCENAPLMRIGQGNIDIAAATAPRPLGLTAADDWTIELQTKGYPDLVGLYEMLGHPDRLLAVFHTQFPHNYNLVNRMAMYGFFNKHFNLGFEEPIEERDFQPLSREEATVWAPPYERPSGDQVGDAYEIRLLKLATEHANQTMQRLIPKSSAEVAEFRRVVGGGWDTILGRQLAQVGDVTFAESRESSQETHKTRVGLIEHAGEQIPTLIREPKGTVKDTMIWITSSGKAEMAQHEAEVQQFLAAGRRVITADLFGQGESADGEPDAQRMWYQPGSDEGWQRFSGYTFGYNHCLFVKRVHDILTLVKFAQGESAGEIELVGFGEVAGPLVLAARSQAGDAIEETRVKLNGFRFENVTRHNHPMFVPGAVKYLDVDGLIALSAPAKLTIDVESPIAKKVYTAVAAAKNFSTSSQLSFPID